MTAHAHIPPPTPQEAIEAAYRAICKRPHEATYTDLPPAAFADALERRAAPELQSVLQRHLLRIRDVTVPEDQRRTYIENLVTVLVDAKLGALVDFPNVGAHRSRRDAFVAAVNADDHRPAVVFIAERPYFQILREARWLARRGWRPFLLALAPLPSALAPAFHDAFAAVLDGVHQPSRLISVLRRLHPAIIHVQCWMWGYHIGRLAIENKGAAACVCEFYDLTSVIAERDVLCRNWPAEAVDRDLAFERYIFCHADAIVHRFPADVIADVMHAHGASPPVAEMHSYPCPDFVRYSDDKLSAADGIIRIVFAGGIIPQNDSHPPALFPEAGLLASMRKLVEQGFAVDVLHDPNRRVDPNSPEFTGFVDLARENPRFRLLPGEPPDRLASRLSRYDYGMILSVIDPDVLAVRPALMRGAVGTKLFAYFEAGLPVLVNAEYRYMSSIVSENGIGLPVHSTDIDDLARRLRNFDYAAAVRNVRHFNSAHGLDAEIGRLTTLYDTLRSQTRSLT